MSRPRYNIDSLNREGRQEAWPVVASMHAGYMSLAQAAGYLAVSTRTIRRWIADRGLPHYFVGGSQRGKLLFRKGELDRWARQFKNGLERKSGR